MGAGTAQFMGKIYFPEFKELDRGNCYLKFNLGMSIYDRVKKVRNVEFVSLVAFGELAKRTYQDIQKDGHDFCMAFAEVRCNPFITKSGQKNHIPSFQCTHICTKKFHGDPQTGDAAPEDSGNGETPF
jgi:hypothetical protein